MDGLRQARAFAQAVSRRGATIYLRAQPTGAGTAQNPPILENPVLAAAANLGDTQISISAKMATGQLLAGDTIIVAGVSVQVAQPAASSAPPFSQANPPGFANVMLVAPLIDALPSGAPLSLMFLADTPIKAIISGFPLTVTNRDGSLIETNDLRVIVAAYGNPAVTDASKLLINGDLRAVLNVVTTYAGATVVKLEILAR